MPRFNGVYHCRTLLDLSEAYQLAADELKTAALELQKSGGGNAIIMLQFDRAAQKGLEGLQNFTADLRDKVERRIFTVMPDGFFKTTPELPPKTETTPEKPKKKTAKR